jgi:pimeloyl-ACP methyl ester carboxylesterase
LIFFPGLNTFADDRVHIGPIAFGSMTAAWQRAARNHQQAMCAFRPPSRSLKHEVADALARLDRLAGEQALGSAKIGLLGHSTGGLVARALASLRPDLVSVVVTVGSPHGGSPGAERALAFPQNHPLCTRFFNASGYAVEPRLEAYASLTAAAARDFAQAHPIRASTRTHYGECRVEPERQPVPLRLLRFLLADARPAPASDGLIPCASQAFGERIGTYRLDHYAEMGAVLFAGAKARAATRAEFARLATDVFKAFATPPGMAI